MTELTDRLFFVLLIFGEHSFFQRIQLEKQWESKIGDELKWKKQLKEKALALKHRIMIILKSRCDWMDDESKRYE